MILKGTIKVIIYGNQHLYIPTYLSTFIFEHVKD